MKESDIQIKIISYLSSIAREHNIFYFSPLNETAMMIFKMFKVPEKTAYRIINFLKKMGLIPGVPDIVILWKGKSIFIEVKRAGEKLGNNQERIHEMIKKAGGNAWTVFKFEDVKTVLIQEGVEL